MLKRQSWVLVGLLAVAACDLTFDGGGRPPHGAQRDRASATTAIWNAGPGDPRLVPEPTNVQMFAPGTAVPFTGGSVSSTATKKTLVLYDTTNTWGYLGELYAIGASNLASHFGTWTAKPVSAYTCGELASYDALIYMGSTFDEPLPTCMLDDVLATTKPVIWTYDNIWKLQDRAGGSSGFATRYGWYYPFAFDTSSIASVSYKGVTVNRYAANGNGIVGTTITDPSKVTVLANAIHGDSTTSPWALRSGNLTFVADLPFTYMTEEDRYLIFADLLFDALAPSTAERHRMVVRLEDISPEDDPGELMAAADYLYSQDIPFGFGVISQYEDPYGYYNGGTSESVRLADSPDLADAIRYAQGHGGVLLMHGYTHQYKMLMNPYTAVSGDDDEFYRVTEDPVTHVLTYVGPTPTDSVKATTDRINSAKKNFQRAHVSYPQIWETPHYAATPNAYKAVKAAFTRRWERTLYFPGVLSGKPPAFANVFGQLYPYLVKDAYGTLVVPENLGNIEPEPFYTYPTRFPEQIINAARLNMVVRDGTAGFYFHPFFDLAYLQDTVEGIQALGYEFVSPNDL